MLPPSQSSEFGRGRRSVVGALLAGALLLVSSGADAQSRLLDALRSEGVVGERFDGFAVLHGPASADVTALLTRVNAERRAIYEQNAASQKVPVGAIGKIYAQEILKSAPAKTWFLSESGQWSQK
jgi:uncharacterized protein YdbL (DUF1318 family)